MFNCPHRPFLHICSNKGLYLTRIRWNKHRVELNQYSLLLVTYKLAWYPEGQYFILLANSVNWSQLTTLHGLRVVPCCTVLHLYCVLSVLWYMCCTVSHLYCVLSVLWYMCCTVSHLYCVLSVLWYMCFTVLHVCGTALLYCMTRVYLDRVSVPSPIAVDILMVQNGERQSSHVPVFCVNLERHICTHITTNIKCYLHSLRYVYVPFTNI